MPPTDVLLVDQLDPGALAAVIEPLLERRHGWANVLPEIPDDIDVPPTPGRLAIFNKRGPLIPMGTWTAPSQQRDGGVAPSELGILHGQGARVVEKLAGTAGELPSGWQVVQDHPRRGLVVSPTAGASTNAIATWLLGALGVLCIPPRTDRFRVYLYDK